MFFFEKKTQKTFKSLGSLSPERAKPKESKVFCFFFSKKKSFLSSASVGLGLILLTAVTAAAHVVAYPRYAAFHDGLDQSYYLEAARAWAALDLSPARHHYLPLYPLLGAAFVWLTPAQPFMLPDLLCLLASLLIFLRIGRRLAPGWSDGVLALCFLVAVLSGKWMVFWLWVVPWTSTGSAPLQFLAVLLALRFGECPAPGRAAWLGVCIGLVGGFRPSDAGVLAASTGGYALFALHRGRATSRDWVLTACAGFGGLLGGTLPWLAAHAAIFGLSGGPYIQKSAAIGFEFRLLPMRWVTLVIDPRPLLPSGAGMAEVLPWIIPGIAGMLTALMPRPGRPVAPAALAAATVSLHWALYLTYRDLNPDGLWRFVNVHYFKWTFPFLTLWAAQFAVALTQRREGRPRALAAAAITLALFAWRPLLRKPESIDVASVQNASGGESLSLTPGISRLDRAMFIGLSGTWEEIHAGKFVLHNASAEFRSQYAFKVLPVPAGALIFPLRPLPPGPALLDLPAGMAIRPSTDVRQYRQAITLGLPCGIFPRRRSCASPL